MSQAVSDSRRPAGFTSTDALLALMVVIWGVNFIVLKAALAEVTPLALNAIRFSVAAVAVAGIAIVRGAPHPPRAAVPRLALMGFLGNSVYQLGFIEGLSRTLVGNAALLMAAVPVQTAVVSHLVGHEQLRRRDLLGLACSTAGIAAIILGGGKAVGFGPTLTGDLMILAATLCWTAYTIGTKPLADRYGATTATAWTMGFGAVPLVLIAIPAMRAQPWGAVSASAWAGIVFSALGALVVAYLIWNRGVRRLGPSRTAIYSNFTPVVAMMAAWAVLGERPTGWQVAGAAGIFSGIYLTRT
jgi:drug/metabolite transporter (DMT)-like permease